MIGYVTLGSNDLQKATEFYSELLAEQGASVLVSTDRMVLFARDGQTPYLGICIPFDQQPATRGNGTMVSLLADSKEQVQLLHDKALALGATNDGDVGVRVPGVFYGGYFLDLDGNKLAVYCGD